MKKQKPRNKSVRQLRQVIGKSQAQFAAMIGVSRDTIISLENGRIERLSPKVAQLISMATGADAHHLMTKATIPPPWGIRTKERHYTRRHFDIWRTHFIASDEKTASELLSRAQGWMELIFLTAGKENKGESTNRLPAVWNSFVQWMNETRETFKLAPKIDALLKQRPDRDGELPGPEKRRGVVVTTLGKDTNQAP